MLWVNIYTYIFNLIVFCNNWIVYRPTAVVALLHTIKACTYMRVNHLLTLKFYSRSCEFPQFYSRSYKFLQSALNYKSDSIGGLT